MSASPSRRDRREVHDPAADTHELVYAAVWLIHLAPARPAVTTSADVAELMDCSAGPRNMKRLARRGSAASSQSSCPSRGHPYEKHHDGCTRNASLAVMTWPVRELPQGCSGSAVLQRMIAMATV